MYRINRYIACLVLLFPLLLTACGPTGSSSAKQGVAEGVAHYKVNALSAVADLTNSLNKQELVNAAIVNNYADKLAKTNPDLANVALMLKKEASVEGASYLNLRKRLTEIQDKDRALTEKELFHPATVELVRDEYSAIARAADKATFNDSLIDVINTLADLSGGELNRINIERLENPGQGDEQLGAGQHLVGNPTYGQWEQSSDGTNFWMWYGAYRMFGDVFSGYGDNQYRRNQPITFENYQKQRKWSYYNDLGRNYHGTQADKSVFSKSVKKLPESSKKFVKPAKSFGSVATERKVSSYQKKTAEAAIASRKSSSYGGSSSNNSTKTASKPTKSNSSNGNFRSSYGKSSGGSFRGK